MICVCQGAARHYTHGDRGVHDFDNIWGLLEAIPGHPFPYRRQGQHDFGPSKFGHDPELGNKFVGRQVGVFGRSISKRATEAPRAALRQWLRDAHTKSSDLLAKQPVVVIWPRSDFGHIIWDGVR